MVQIESRKEHHRKDIMYTLLYFSYKDKDIMERMIGARRRKKLEQSSIVVETAFRANLIEMFISL